MMGISSNWKSKKEAPKVCSGCEHARVDGYEYVRIDTCCIDKSNGAELSEAINSAFRWYAESDVCYAFLNDAEKESTITGRRWYGIAWAISVSYYDSSLESLLNSYTDISKRMSWASNRTT
ncbi:heterokaryon incompatibility protein-domain-containing protein [Xylaria telfairii]|nr:heterokaryon incompatibility protein-domain-containing protein [Xylaria telfairii]